MFMLLFGILLIVVLVATFLPNARRGTRPAGRSRLMSIARVVLLVALLVVVALFLASR